MIFMYCLCTCHIKAVNTDLLKCRFLLSFPMFQLTTDDIACERSSLLGPCISQNAAERIMEVKFSLFKYLYCTRFGNLSIPPFVMDVITYQ